MARPLWRRPSNLGLLRSSFVGLKESVRNWRQRRAERQANKAWEVIAPVIERATASRWEVFLSSLAPDVREFLAQKWRLSNWDPGEGPPRPRSVEEMAGLRGIAAGEVRRLDWTLVDHARDHHRRYDPALPRFVAVPIDVAQEWWDDEWGWMYNPDGTRRPRDEWGKEPSRANLIEQGKRVHSFEDEEELRLHLVRDHGHEYVKPGGPTYSGDHRNAHLDEAEISEWDRRYRGIDLPPPPLAP